MTVHAACRFLAPNAPGAWHLAGVLAHDQLHGPLHGPVNLATGGGWPANLSRYSGLADMYIDYIRVYQQKK